jgi:hypothetical protein
MRLWWMLLVLWVLWFPGCAWLATISPHPIVVGSIEFDPPTIHTVGVSLPILEGDEDFNASVLVSYRRVGYQDWHQALRLQRVRTDLLSRAVPTRFVVAEQFAGSIFDLEAGTEYEVSLAIDDPEGGKATRTGTVRTRSVPLDGPSSPHIVSVNSDRGLATALAQAQPGDVIQIGAGHYSGPFRLERSGTVANPIVVKGAGRRHTIIESPDSDYGVLITGSDVYLEDLTIRLSAWGIKVMNVSNVVVRGIHIHDVHYGINARSGVNRNLYICDNLLKGDGVHWPDTSNRTWDYEGIVVTGSGHVVCHNTVSGFGDALGLSQPTDIPNRAIDFYGNDVLWGGDDGIELDYSERNVRAFRNRFGNVGMGISFQPIWGGPVYAFRNIIYNTATAPYKLNQDPSGFHIFHNTSIRPGWAWQQYGEHVSNFSFHNNLTIGTDKAVYMTPFIQLADIDYNGWSPDGEFTLDYPWNGFAALQRRSPYEQHGRLLTIPIFLNAISAPRQFSAFMAPPATMMLHAESNAIDAGLRLPNINDEHTGAAPDLGAVEQGLSVPSYGVRWTHGAGEVQSTVPSYEWLLTETKPLHGAPEASP